MKHEICSLRTVSAAEGAQRLLGSELIRELDGNLVRVRIVETEAYDQTDAASHSYNRRTQRTDVMFGPAGHLYVYFTYGMHYCMNIVVGPEGYGAGVLIRAVEPIEGETTLRQYRDKSGAELTNGPAKLCQAMNVDKSMNGHNLMEPPIQLILREPLPEANVVTTQRIGISKAVEQPWRFCEVGNSYLSRM